MTKEEFAGCLRSEHDCPDAVSEDYEGLAEARHLRDEIKCAWAR